VGGELELPPFVDLGSEKEYRARFDQMYCSAPISTFDGIAVRFRKRQFDHCFFESTTRDGVKNQFSTERARRIDWIRAVLESPDAELYQGWDNRRRRRDPSRRVAVVLGEYVVIIALVGDDQADFVTAFVSDPPGPGRLSAVQEIRRGPKWAKENR
jgi:hypothetical protein